jgi:hypothetical protein
MLETAGQPVTMRKDMFWCVLHVTKKTSAQALKFIAKISIRGQKADRRTDVHDAFDDYDEDSQHDIEGSLWLKKEAMYTETWSTMLLRSSVDQPYLVRDHRCGNGYCVGL